MILIYITCKNKKEAERIGLHLIKKRLAGCVNIFPVDSIYWWSSSAKATADKNGKIVKSREAVLIVKTLEKSFRDIEREVKKLHSYTAPCILEIPIAKGNREYLNWLKKEVKYGKL